MISSNQQGFCHSLRLRRKHMHVVWHTTHAPRVACFGILKLQAGCMALFAPDCRSWGAPARGTSFRNPCNPNGIGRPFVLDGNKMASRILACMQVVEDNWSTCMPYNHACTFRMVLLCLLCLSNHAIFLVEQPRQSLLYAYYRWQWLQNRVAWASCIAIECVACAMHTCSERQGHDLAVA